MFFAASILDNGTEINIPIRTNNVFTRCPGCGKPLSVNLENLLDDGISNLEDTYIYCRNPRCGGKTVAARIPGAKGRSL